MPPSLGSSEDIVQKTRVSRQTRSLGDFGAAFGVNCDFKGRGVLTRRLWELCHTVVVKMLHDQIIYSVVHIEPIHLSYQINPSRLAR